jgi:FkbM family methyltransferase
MTWFRPVKSFARASVRRMPGRETMIRQAALLPPRMKARFGRHIARLLEHPAPNMGLIDTNLGIAGGHRFQISADAGIDLFYGTPETIVGEAHSLRLARILAPRCDVFVDVGANHGLYLFFLRSVLPICTHFIEPNPALFAELQANVRRACLSDVHGHQIAMADREGRVSFSLDVTDPSSSSIVEFCGNRDHELRQIEVECSTFEAFAVQQQIRNALVKVDIEGAAHLFMAGAAREFGRIAYLIIEPIGSTSEMLARVPNGVHCYYINGPRFELKTAGIQYNDPEWNWLLCWHRPEELQKVVAPAGFEVSS